MSTIILGAGIGKRMYSKTPKILHEILGKPIISFVVDTTENIKSDEIIIVVGKNFGNIRKTVGRKVRYAIQPVPLGTGDAAKKGLEAAAYNNVLILCGDVPLLQGNTILNLIDYHIKAEANLTFLTCQTSDPYGYGRIVRNKTKKIMGIIEQSEATTKQLKIKEINAGVYYGAKKSILSTLDKLSRQNRQAEFYLTDIVKEMLEKRKKVVGLKINNEEEIMGVNSKVALVKAREVVKMRWFEQLMSNGVYIEDPASTNIDLSVKIGKHVRIRPHTLIEGKTKIKDGATVGPFTWIRNGVEITRKRNV